MSIQSEPGEVITFYSYKGGTGRSMALANVACLLAMRQSQEEGRDILVVDWDLEAPGLHRFFRDRFKQALRDSNDHEAAIKQYPGLIDLFDKIQSTLQGLPEAQEEPPPETEQKLRATIRLEDFILETDLPHLHFLKAGRFDEGYAKLVNTFKWEELYHLAPWIYSWFSNWLSERYRYVLIDSRTGITDTSGICTTLMPEKLVVVFTPNRQSLEGALDQVRQAISYRGNSDDLRPLTVFPLVTRIEADLEELRAYWRSDPVIGYQPRFEELFKTVNGMSRCDLKPYFDEIQILQVRDYAYGEEIAVLTSSAQDKYSLGRTYEVFTDLLLSGAMPWESPAQAKARSSTAESVRLASVLFARLSLDQQIAARHVLTRLVVVGATRGDDQPKKVRLEELDSQLREAAIGLISAHLLKMVNDEDTGENVIEFAEPGLLREWEQFRSWLEEDREFLLWLQRLRILRSEWERAGRDKRLLLRGSSLEEAEKWTLQKAPELDDADRRFVSESAKAGRREIAAKGFLRTIGPALMAFVAVVFATLSIYWGLGRIPREALMASQSGTTDSLSSIHGSSDGSRLWAVGDEGVILHSADQGLHWMTQPSGTRQLLTSVFAKGDGSELWIVGKGGTILETSDGGEHWSAGAIHTSVDFYSVYGTSDGKGVWAVGRGGAILKASEGGQEWIAQKSGTTEDLFSIIQASDSMHVWAVGVGGTILKSGDGGGTWNLQNSGTSNSLKSICASSNGLVLFAVGDRGTVLTSSDGGGNWYPRASGTSNSLTSIDCSSNGSRFWAAGDNGILLYSADSGQHLEAMPSGTSNSLSSLYWNRGSQTLWAVGSLGTVLRSRPEQKYLQLSRGLLTLLRSNNWAMPTASLALAYVFVLLLFLATPAILLSSYRSMNRAVELLPSSTAFAFRLLTRVTGISALAMHPRTLDAWLNRHIGDIQQQYLAEADEQPGEPYIPLPVRVSDIHSSVQKMEPSAEAFSVWFRRPRTVLVLVGRGGSGKTTLAVALGRWGLEGQLAGHRMVPLLIQADTDDLRSAIAVRLAGYFAENVESELIEALLRHRRLLVIIDGLSERREDTSKNLLGDSSMRNLVVTSRSPVNLAGRDPVIVTLEPLDPSDILRFLTNLLMNRTNNRFMDITDQLEIARRLAALTQFDRDRVPMTPLLVKLFAERALSLSEQGSSIEDLPTSIPDLYFEFLRKVNPQDPGVANRMHHDEMLKAAGLLAKLSLEPDFVPKEFVLWKARALLSENGWNFPASRDPIERLLDNGVLEQKVASE